MQNNILVQVTIASVRLVDSDNFNMLFEYLSPGNITVAAGNCEQIIIAISGGQLQYLELDDTGRALEVKQSIVLDQDVACLSLLENPNPAEKMDVDESDAAQNLLFNKSTLLALAMWTDHTVRLLALPNFQEVNRVMLGSETQARDIMLATLEDKTYLMVGLGDGHIITYNVDFSTDLPTVKNMRKGVVGTHPISFKAFQFGDEICIFAACDRSTILYSRNGKLLFSVLNVNMSDIISVTTFHSELFPECLVLSSEAGFMIGTIEDIQKMHIQTIPLGETPRRIAHNTKRNVYAGNLESFFDENLSSTLL